MAKKIAIGLLIGILAITLSVGLSGCNAEKKALKPYKAVNSDVDTSFKAKKKELVARVCAINFPTQEKIVIKDSIRTKIVRVQDNSMVNKLKAQLAKGCPTLNIDSIYNELPLDTVYVDRWHSSDKQGKDTTGNYFRQQNENELRNHANILEADNTSLKKQISDIAVDLNEAKKEKNKWKLYFFLLLSAGIVYKVAKIYLSKSFTLPKIF